MDANATLGQPRLLISTEALEQNLRVIRRHLEPSVQICAVVKADAYGHGATLIAEALARIEERTPFLKVDQFAVATIEEAATLARFKKPIMALRPIENVLLGQNRDLIELALRHNWTLTIATPSAADDIARLAIQCNCRGLVQVMLDTGMTRCGTSAEQFNDLIDRVQRHPSLKLSGVSTHFVNSEIRGDALTSRQLRGFERAIGQREDLKRITKHAANSGAIFFTPRSHFDVVRPGLSLYGVDPTGHASVDRPLRPVMKWTAPIIALHDIAPGTTVGYNQTWTAAQDSRIAVIPVGYADGYPRIASNRAVMGVHGHRAGVVGRVSMDMTAIDVTNVPDVRLGDEVIVIDSDPTAPNSIYGIARLADTIPYEILTRIGPRIRRVLASEEMTTSSTSDDNSAQAD